eukprot:COSAG01_NODE_7285_length_3271_cov_3.212484_2_plen_129_part_00
MTLPSGYSGVTQAASCDAPCCEMYFHRLSPMEIIKVEPVNAADVRGEVALIPAITGHMSSPSDLGTPGGASIGSTPAKLLKVANQSQMHMNACVVLPRIWLGRKPPETNADCLSPPSNSVVLPAAVVS